MRPSLRALAALLSYPSAELLAALPEVRAALAADPDIAPAMPGLDRLLAQAAASDLLDLAEQHVGLFDRTRSLCLNLFEHVHGDSRERGPAMVELKQLYAAAGLEIEGGELPDYLPMLLEYAALEPASGRELLANAAPVIDLLHGRLLGRQAPQAAVLHAVLLLAGVQPSAAPAPEAEETAAQLDALWAEAPVAFGGVGADPAAECGVDLLAAKLRAASRNPLGAAQPPPTRRPVIRHVAASSQG